MIALTFQGTKEIGGNQFVNVIYIPEGRIITAVDTNGGTPSVTYTAFSNYLQENDLIFLIQEDDQLVRVFFTQYYPFGYITVTDNEPEVPVINIDAIAVTPQTAQGQRDGTAVITASGGTIPYQYSLNGFEFQVPNNFSGLPYGEYMAFVKSGFDPITKMLFTIAPAAVEPEPVEPEIKDVIALQGAEISIQNAYKRVDVVSEFGKVPSLLYNGDFEDWDGANFRFWTRYGGLNFSRIQRTVTNVNGVQVPIENYAIRFNQKFDGNKFIQSSVIPVAKGDKLKIQYNVSRTDTIKTTVNYGLDITGDQIIRTVVTQTFYAFKIGIVLSSEDGSGETVTYYLYNQDNGTAYEWRNDVSVVTNLIDNQSGDLRSFTFSFDMPEAPAEGQFVLQLYGFEKYQIITTTDKSGTSNKELTVLNEYQPVDVDDILVSRSSQDDKNDITGLYSASENPGYYTEKPDLIKILFGDFFSNAAGKSSLGNLYAIMINNTEKEYTSGWYEYGITSSPVPFGLALAKTILRAYQKPFRLWMGGLQLQPLAPAFSYLDVFSFDVPGQQKFNSKLFTILGGDIDLKYNTLENVKLAEIFDRPAKSTDITVPSYPGSTPPVFVQDPNGNANNTGIFTEQFRPEFS